MPKRRYVLRNTKQLASMSWMACFFSVKPAMIYPMPKGITPEIIFAKWRPDARPKEILAPPKSVTDSPRTFLPVVACHSELSSSA